MNPSKSVNPSAAGQKVADAIARMKRPPHAKVNLGAVDGVPAWKNSVTLTDIYYPTKDVNRGVDALLFCRVVSMALTAPPGSPANGALYIPKTGATGAWAGKANQLARYSSSAGWEFFAPKAQWRIRCVADGYDYVYSGSAWAVQEKPIAQITGLQAALDAKARAAATFVTEATTARTPA